MKQMKPYHPSIKTALLAGLLAGAFAATCSADIIYQDTFARASAGPLNGSPPTVDNTGAGATWTADAAFNSDGTMGVVNNSYFGGASLPLNWSTYSDPRVQVDVKLGDSGTWFQLVLGSCNYWGTPGETAVFQLSGNGDVSVFSGPGYGFTTLTNLSGAGVPLGWNRLRIEYSNSLGTASFYLNGTVILQDAPITSQSTGVGFDFFGGPNTDFTNLLVTFGNEAVFPPSITTQPQGETIFVGDPISVSMQAAGTLPIQYIWCTNGVPIPGPNANTFTLPAAALSDSANYSVIITNAYGAKTSDVVRVDVHLEQQTPLAQRNFDNLNTSAYEFAFAYSSDSTLTLPTTSATAPGDGTGGSNGFRISTDGTEFQTASVTYAGFGGGVGFSIPTPATHNLDFYEAYFSARVENLVSTATNASGRAAVRFYAPDGTIGATDGNQDLIFSVTIPVTYTSNFQNFAFVLNTGDYGGASGLAAFTQYRANINRIQFEFTLDNFYSSFVNGPGDAIVLDNLKFAYRQSPPITVTWNGTQAVIHWDDPNVILQGAANVAGPYVNIGGAASPYPVPGASPYHYFRTQFTPVP